MTEGVVYVVNGEPFIKMVIHSIKSLKKISNLPVTLCAPRKYFEELKICDADLVELPLKYQQSPPRDTIGCLGSYCKFFGFNLMPYDVNFFIDADTQILRNPREAYDPNFDFAGCQDLKGPVWKTKKFNGFSNGFNSGFLIYKKIPSIKNLFIAAENCYLNEEFKTPDISDQQSINRVLKRSFIEHGIKINILDPRWNARPPIWDKFKDYNILHCHGLYHLRVFNEVSNNWATF